MADAIAQVSKSKPEIRLARSVSIFKATLSAAEKSSFNEIVTAIQKQPPNATDVARWIAELDRAVNRATRRCLGPRFMNVLQAVQQYAALGDIVLGGSQNLIACGVWAVVRLTIKALSQGLPYLEKLSLLFMNAGRNAPRYQNMALLYPCSTRLQDGLCQWFIILVDLCQNSVSLLQESIPSQTPSALLDSSLSLFEKHLQRWSTDILDEVTFLTSQMPEDKARENSWFREMTMTVSARHRNQRRVESKIRILDGCSTYDYQTTWKQVRKNGRTAWYKTTAEYKKWKSHPSSMDLFCIGKMGAGKSTVMADIVDDVHSHSPNGTVAYFFCRYDIVESLVARTIFGCLARQLLAEVDLKKKKGLAVDVRARPPDEHAILQILDDSLSKTSVYYVIVDGLDECPDNERHTVLNLLRQMQSRFNVLACISSRKDAESYSAHIQDRLRQKLTLNMTVPEDNPDISAYISDELEYRLQSGRLGLDNPDILLSIQEALLKKAQGNFLWAVLLLDCMCMEHTDEDIIHALDNLPTNLSDIFMRVLQKGGFEDSGNCRKLLQLITVARRPFTVAELQEALRVIPGDTNGDPAQRINNIRAILACCSSLIIVDEEEDTVRFAHSSVKQFFSTYRDQTNLPQPIDAEEANRELGRIILTYLNYGIFASQAFQISSPSITTADAPAQIATAASNRLDSSARRIALGFRGQSKSSSEIGRSRLNRPVLLKEPAPNYHFVRYAKENLKDHIFGVWNESEAMRILWYSILTNDSLNISTTQWVQYELRRCRLTSLSDSFVPEDCVQQIFQPIIIHRVLLEAGMAHNNAGFYRKFSPRGNKRYFAILVDIGHSLPITNVYKEVIQDEELPIPHDKIQRRLPTFFCDLSRDAAGRPLGDLFLERQIKFTASFFRQEDHHELELVQLAFLPMTASSSQFHGFQTALVHPAHHSFDSAYSRVEDNSGGFPVIIKTVFHNEFHPGTELLRIVIPSDKPLHLVRPLASFTSQYLNPGNANLIFPLADATLEEFWLCCPARPTLSVLIWSLEQVVAISTALHLIHNFTNYRDHSCTWVSPENILWFKRPLSGSSEWGSLRIAPGLIATSKHTGQCSVIDHLYAAPGDTNHTRLWERSDVWSLACLCIDLLVWADMGSQGIDRMRYPGLGSIAGTEFPGVSKYVNWPLYLEELEAERRRLRKIPHSPPLLRPWSETELEFPEDELPPEVQSWAARVYRTLGHPELTRPVISYLMQNALVMDDYRRVSMREFANDLTHIIKGTEEGKDFDG